MASQLGWAQDGPFLTGRERALAIEHVATTCRRRNYIVTGWMVTVDYGTKLSMPTSRARRSAVRCLMCASGLCVSGVAACGAAAFSVRLLCRATRSSRAET